MNWATIALVVLFAMALGSNLTNHGRMRTTEYNFWWALVVIAFEMWLIYKSGGLR